ncbi:MAG TPA: transcription antitermination factor NusB [Propionibacteriaceae bacterium]|nr:transcription antitermination factor NusB [Propionibacteriaceae bacterium]
MAERYGDLEIEKISDDLQPAFKPSARTKARKAALDILFEAEIRGRDPRTTLDEHTAEADPPVRDFTRELVRGYCEFASVIDQRIAECTTIGWTLERMPSIDRNLARIAIFEIDHTDIEPGVAIAEAVTLASQFSTEESPAYLNGLLAKAAATRG